VCGLGRPGQLRSPGDRGLTSGTLIEPDPAVAGAYAFLTGVLAYLKVTGRRRVAVVPPEAEVLTGT